jgi:FkbM family methyltransferase
VSRAVDTYRSIKAPVRPFVRARWNRPPFITGARLAQRYLNLWGNNDHNLARNGEADVLRRLAQAGVELETVVDAGCHVGAWTDQLLSFHPGAAVHAFEADPTLAADLEKKYADRPAVVVNAAGLAGETGTQVLFVNESGRDVSSMVEDPDAVTTPVEVPVHRGDEYARAAGIERIDFLKIDTEGFDWTVLSGFDSMLGPNVRMLQFEYNTWNIRCRRLLADFYELLEPLGYRVGKVHLNGVDYKRYASSDENWVGPACIAVHESWPEALTATAVR